MKRRKTILIQVLGVLVCDLKAWSLDPELLVSIVALRQVSRQCPQFKLGHKKWSNLKAC